MPKVMWNTDNMLVSVSMCTRPGLYIWRWMQCSRHCEGACLDVFARVFPSLHCVHEATPESASQFPEDTMGASVSGAGCDAAPAAKVPWNLCCRDLIGPLSCFLLFLLRPGQILRFNSSRRLQATINLLLMPVNYFGFLSTAKIAISSFAACLCIVCTQTSLLARSPSNTKPKFLTCALTM